MKFFQYEDVPLFLGVSGKSGEYIFADQASISVSQELNPVRYLDDNIIGFTGTTGYSMSAGVNSYTFGPSGGPPQPISTSIYKIPSGTKVTFPNNKYLFFDDDVSPNGHNYISNLRSYSGFVLNSEESQMGHFDPIYKYTSSGPVKGSMSVSFYVNNGNLPHFFNITGLSNPSQYPPIDEERVTGHLGDFRFSNAYLKKLSFSLAPNSMSKAQANFDIYGSLVEDLSITSNYYSSSLYKQRSVPHGMSSNIMGTSDHGIDTPIGFSYNIDVSRSPRFEIGTGNKASSDGLIPTRVSKDRTSISMSIEGERINPNILSEGFGGKRANLSVNLRDLNYSSFDENNKGLLHTFNCSGVIENQALSVSKDGYLKGSISVKQHYK